MSIIGDPMSDGPSMQQVDVTRIFLDLENPRHDPYQNEAEVIDYLCRYENVFPLAKDIVDHGLNPLELLAVVPEDAGDGAMASKSTYIVAEGNRRLCAIKLLADPERAPVKLRKLMEDLSREWDGVGELTCMVFPDKESVRMWLGRIHEGEQGGIGRKKWNADQTARHSGDSKNKTALAILDYAEAAGMITAENRKGKLTTVQRYLVNQHVREAFGIDNSNINDISRNRPKPDFDLILRKFLDDLGRGHVNSRANKEQHNAYARELTAIQGLTREIVPTQSLKPTVSPRRHVSMKRPPKPKPRRFIAYSPEIMQALDAIGGVKLPNLYNSICTVTLESHAPLVGIGVWAFLESLSAKAGRLPQTDFPTFFGKAKLHAYGLSKGKGDKAVLEAVRRVAASGDVAKHDGTAALFNGEQLVNDMETLNDLVLRCAEEAVAQS